MEDEFTSVRWERESTVKDNDQLTHTPPQSSFSEPQEETSKPEPITKDDTLAKKSIGDYEDDETTYINCKVSSPQRENDGQNAYISYLIETQTNDPTFKNSKLKVRRRFSDFYFLYQCLLNDYPASALPPLPDKQRLEYLKGDRFSFDFTSKRASSLNRFLNRMSLHPLLKRAKIFHIFLESNEWNSYKDSLNVNHSPHDHNDELNNSTSIVADSISDLFMNAFKHPQAQPNKEFVEITERCNKLNDNVIKIDKGFQKYIKRLGDLSSNFQNFGELILKLDQLENSNPLDGNIDNKKQETNIVATANDGEPLIITDQPEIKTIPSVEEEVYLNVKNRKSLNDPNISSYSKFSKGLENLAFGLNNLKRHLDNDYLISLKDLENYIYSIKNLIKIKEQKQIDFEALSEYLARAIQEKNQLLQQTGGMIVGTNDELNTPHSTISVTGNPNIPLPTPKPSTLTTLATSTSNFLTSKFDDIRGINSSYQKREKLIKLGVKIETLEKEVINAKKIFEIYENEILHEVQYFDVIKSNELKGNLKSLTSSYVDFYKNVIDDWEKIETSLEKDIEKYNVQVK